MYFSQTIRIRIPDPKLMLKSDPNPGSEINAKARSESGKEINDKAGSKSGKNNFESTTLILGSVSELYGSESYPSDSDC
jgi:hypothetical protein